MASENNDYTLINKEFDYIDLDGNEELSFSEVKYFLSAMGFYSSTEDLEAFYAEMDTDGNGKIDREEFILFASQKLNELNWKEQIKQIFEQLDQDGNGFITTEEFKEMFKQIGTHITEEEVEDLVKEADQDGNGKIDYLEFINMMLDTDEECITIL